MTDLSSLFTCKPQEIHDPHTGVFIAFGRHEAPGPDRDGHAWMRITATSPANLGIEAVTKTSTIIFGDSEEVLSVSPHKANFKHVQPTEEELDPHDPNLLPIPELPSVPTKDVEDVKHKRPLPTPRADSHSTPAHGKK
jgi:hypothetical protein